jgi:hypothetical protein
VRQGRAEGAEDSQSEEQPESGRAHGGPRSPAGCFQDRG